MKWTNYSIILFYFHGNYLTNECVPLKIAHLFHQSTNKSISYDIYFDWRPIMRERLLGVITLVGCTSIIHYYFFYHICWTILICAYFTTWTLQRAGSIIPTKTSLIISSNYYCLHVFKRPIFLSLPKIASQQPIYTWFFSCA